MKTELIDQLADNHPECAILRLDGSDDSCVGWVCWSGRSPILCYSIKSILAQFMSDGMDEEEAEEFFEFNTIGAWMGEGTPCFLVDTGGRRSIIRFGGERRPANQLQSWPKK